MSGRNDFPLVITPKDISNITDMITLVSPDKLYSQLDYNDLQTALVIKALIQYMENMHVMPGFRLEEE